MNTILLPGGGHGNRPLQYACLENPMDKRSLEGYSPRGCKQSDTTEVIQHAHTHYSIVCIYHILLNHSSVEHVGGFYILAIVENATMYMEVQIPLNPV